jgi:4-amino-4-deoxy-L-arabinose transferase-like glycosyltransferase
MTTLVAARSMRLTHAGAAVGLSLLAAAYVLYAVRFVHEPLMADEIFFVQAAERLSRDGELETQRRESLAVFGAPEFPERIRQEGPSTQYALWHPPTYLHLMALVFTGAGAGAAQARLIGLASFVLTLVATYLLAQQAFESRPDRQRIGLLACLILAINPMALQGSLLIDIDNTVLAPATLLALLAIVKLTEIDRLAGLVAIGLVFALLFWVKLTTPLGLLACLLLLLGVRHGPVPAARRAAIVLTVAGLAFLSSWSLYAWSHGLPLLAPFGHVVGSAFHSPPRGGILTALASVGYTGARLALWVSPFLLLLWAIALGRVFRRAPAAVVAPGEHLLALFSIVVFATYLYIGGLTFSFPRYHYPLLPVVAILAAEVASAVLARTRPSGGLALAGMTLAVLVLLAAGDPLLSTYHEIREALVAGASLAPVATHIAGQAAVLVLVLLLFYVAGRRGAARPRSDALILALALSLFAYSAALDVIQARAGYLTRYGYGGRGTAETIALLKESTEPGDFVFAPAELVFGLGDRSAPYPPNEAWTAEEVLTRVLSRPDTKAFVYGIPTNTGLQAEFAARNPRVSQLLAARFRKRVVGSYTIWLRAPVSRDP